MSKFSVPLQFLKLKSADIMLHYVIIILGLIYGNGTAMVCLFIEGGKD